MKRYWLACLTAALALTGEVRAEKQSAEDHLFQPGRFYVDAGYGGGQLSDNFIPGGSAFLNAYIDLFSLNQTRQMLGASYAIFSKPSETAPKSTRIGFDFAISSWFSMGVAASHLQTTVTNVSVYDQYFGGLAVLTFLMYPIGSTSSTAPPSNFTYLYTLRSDMALSLWTQDVDFTFHVQAGALDPYFRLTSGYGTTPDYAVSKSALSFGARYRLTGNVYAYGEISYAEYDFAVKSSSWNLSLDGGRMKEKAFRFGVGYAFSPPDTPNHR